MKLRERSTKQKQAISRVFERSDRPVTVQEVHQAAGETCDSLGIATVYRAVSRLLASGWLTEVQLPGQPTRYERMALAHHHHFHCDRCEILYDVLAPCDALSTMIPDGFTVRRHELTFYGICESCRVKDNDSAQTQ